MNKIFASMESFEKSRFDTFESCLTNIGFYIIQKIREEDLREDKYTINLDETEESQNMMEEEIKSKISITEMILNNKDILMNMEDFYEEDCQLSLLNWAFHLNKRFRKQNCSQTSLDNYENINKDFFNKKNSLINNLEILLLNILNIFEIFPIKPNDLKSLNFIGKLKKIKKDMKTQNIIIYKKIKILIKFWKSMIKLFDKHKNILISKKNEININLNKKRQRGDEDNMLKDEIKEDNDKFPSNISTDESISYKQNETKKKNVSWKNDNILVDKIEFNPNDAPTEILS